MQTTGPASPDKPSAVEPEAKDKVEAGAQAKEDEAAKVDGQDEDDEEEGEQGWTRGKWQRHRRGGAAGDSAVAMVKRDLLALCLTCPLCDRLLRKATTISECLHTFCRKCIYKKLSDEDLDHCPVCNIDLGCTPVKKLRADHNIQDVRSKLFPFKRKKVNPEEGESPLPQIPAHYLRIKDGSIPALSVQRDSTLPTTSFLLGIDLQLASTDSPETDHSDPIRVVENFKKMLPILEKGLVAMTEKAAQNDALKAKVDALQGHLDEITLEVQELEKEKKSVQLLKEKMASAEAEHNNTKTECEALQSQIKEIPVLGSKIGYLKQEKKALQVENSTWKTQRQAFQTHVEEIPGLRSQIKSLDELVTALKDEKARLEAELKPARSEREKYQIEVNSLRERIGTLEEKDVAWLRSEERHKAALTAFEIQRDKMIRDKSAQDAEIKSLLADQKKVKSQVESYRSQLKAVKLEKEAVAQKIKTFKEKAKCHLIDTTISCSGYLLALLLSAGPDCTSPASASTGPSIDQILTSKLCQRQTWTWFGDLLKGSTPSSLRNCLTLERPMRNDVVDAN